MVKKSYNPLKMWGAYLGLILFLIFVFIIPNMEYSFPVCSSETNFLSRSTCIFRHLQIKQGIIDAVLLFPFILFAKMFGLDISGMGAIGTGLMFVITMPILGFLIGWGIHSLIRRIRK